IVGEAGVTLYTVQGVKRIPGVRNYASVDGGMTDNPRYALYQARHPVLLANRAGEQADDEPWSISGKCCETGDMLIHDAMLPALQPGDLIAMFCTGAYTYSMASNYNRVPRPAVVLVGPGRASLLARRETPEDVARLDQIPDWLEHLP
ncbi:diaminopimelate decarboxylase, partial [bacterium]|nr:diaminopimelate decarboxylase [bacterium]